jgi:ribonuclease E
VERALRDAVKRDRARTKILRTSPFGLIEMTRQRIRPSLKRSVFKDCPACSGAGTVKTAESMAIEAMRVMILASHQPEAARLTVYVADDVATYLANRKRRKIAQLENEANVTVVVVGRHDVSPEHLMLECQDASGREIKLA